MDETDALRCSHRAIRRDRLAWTLAAALAAALPACSTGSGRDAAAATIQRLYRERRSGVFVEGSGSVSRILPDDVRGARHQRFVVELSPGHTLLVSHNIDIAPRIEALAVGDRVSFRGEYVWNERGGLVHWTHRDPARGPAGWVEHRGTRYR